MLQTTFDLALIRAWPIIRTSTVHEFGRKHSNETFWIVFSYCIIWKLKKNGYGALSELTNVYDKMIFSDDFGLAI